MTIKQSARGLIEDTTGDAQSIRDTIQKAWRIQLEAEYTFDTSKYSTVFINDPRGGEISDETLALIRNFRNDQSIQKNQVGMLDSMVVSIENLKGLYDNYLVSLKNKEASGTLTEEERIILNGETLGWPTPTPVLEDPVGIATQACNLIQTQVSAYRETATLSPSQQNKSTGYAYPAPPTQSPMPATSTPPFETPYPGPGRSPNEPQTILCPTSTPTPSPLRALYRGTNPKALSPDELKIQILSVEIDGDIAKAITHKWTITNEIILVKVDGQWFIAGSKLLKSGF